MPNTLTTHVLLVANADDLARPLRTFANTRRHYDRCKK